MRPLGARGCPQWGDLRIRENVQDVETEVPSLGHLTQQGLPLVIGGGPTVQGTSQALRREGPVSRGGSGSGSVRERGAGVVDPPRSQRHRRGHHCGCTGEPRPAAGSAGTPLCLLYRAPSLFRVSWRGRIGKYQNGGDDRGEARPRCDERKKREASATVLRGSPSCCPAPGPRQPRGLLPAGSVCPGSRAEPGPGRPLRPPPL